ncbi:hypothetical protein ACQEU6_03115 [Spirillospora sp. CA-108201]
MPVGPTLTQSYTIRLIQLGPSLGTSDFPGVVGTVTTDEFGNGEANVRENVLSGATHVFVDLNNTADPNGDFFTTEPVSLFR